MNRDGYHGPSGHLGQPPKAMPMPAGTPIPPADEDRPPPPPMYERGPRTVRQAIGDVDAAARVYAAAYTMAIQHFSRVTVEEAHKSANLALQAFVISLDSEVNP